MKVKDEVIGYWKEEEAKAEIVGWDFSYIEGRYYSSDDDLPWEYRDIILKHLTSGLKLLDIDTGGGEFLLSLGHVWENTTVTEGFEPNVQVCRQRLEPLGIRVCEVNDYFDMPFSDNEFDIIINRHGSYDARELHRILKPGGVFVTQQVGEDNDRELVELLLGDIPKPFPGMNLKAQKKIFEDVGFEILECDEYFGPVEFYDIGALVWFAKIIQWEFVGFSVEKCRENLIQALRMLEQDGKVSGSIHRYYIVARK